MTTCKTEIKSKLVGTWAIHQAYINDQPFFWNLIGNSIGLDANDSCNLPILRNEDRHTIKETGIWELQNKNNRTFIQIRTTNDFFNRTFEIKSFNKVKDQRNGGFLLTMTLESDSLVLDCAKAL
jgi:hypothetical protein